VTAPLPGQEGLPPLSAYDTPDPAAPVRSAGDAPVLGEDYRRVESELAKLFYRGTPAIYHDSLPKVASHVAALLAQARDAERERIAQHLELTAAASSSHHNAAIWRAAAQTTRSMS
jgi:hypothetical protein